MKMKLNPKLAKFWKTKSRLKVLYGGRSSSKTHDTGGVAIHLARTYTVRFLCTRQFQNKITESVYTVLKNKIEEAGYSKEFTITNNRIVHNTTKSEFIFYGLWRNIDEIKSLEGVDICWVEEAHSLTREQWEILEPTIRKEDSEIWLVFNPRYRTDFVYKNFIIKKQPNSVVKKINYTDNPFLSKTMLNLIESKKNDDNFRHVYLGEPLEESENSLFSYEIIEKAMEDTYDPEKEEGVTVYGLDVARFGGDKTMLAVRRGLVITELLERTKLSTTEVSSWVANKIITDNVDGIVIDTVGVGAGVYDQLVSQGIGNCFEGNAGMKADMDNFFNKRAEMYWKLKKALENGLKLPKDDDLMEELVSVTYTFTDKGQMKLDSKDKIKEQLGRSPDKADAIALTYFTTIIPQSTNTIDNFSHYKTTNGAW